MFLRTVALCALVVSMTSCQGLFARKPTLRVATANGPVTFELEVVRSEKARAHGLMDRKSLAQSAGMLFVFDEEDDHTFWMKDTYIALDIIFLSSDWRVVGFIENMQPMSRLSRSVGKVSRYALEVNAGVVQKTGIAIGNTATFIDERK